HGAPGTDPPQPGTDGGLTGHARAMLQRAVIGAAVDLVSGPGGLASVLRTGLLGARLAGPSLPLDVGYAETVPAGIRQAAALRAGRHCEWPGGCWRPASACHVHHVTRKADGGKTSVKDCLLLCSFHHLVAVHRWGWTLILNPDGTTTAWSPDGSKVLHSHEPPPRPG
ncbi:MAG: HNH endonuclease signature motif containing protein, partial [Streptosporangiaceae bacterium]